jgi:hypothetical protein
MTKFGGDENPRSRKRGEALRLAGTMVWLVVSPEVLRVMVCERKQVPPASLRSRVGMTGGWSFGDDRQRLDGVYFVSPLRRVPGGWPRSRAPTPMSRRTGETWGTPFHLSYQLVFAPCPSSRCAQPSLWVEWLLMPLVGELSLPVCLCRLS